MVAAALLAWLAAADLMGQQPQKPSEPGYVVRVSTEIVLVNVIARDKKGNLIRDLKKEDFTVYEDGQKQQLTSFDFENVGNAIQTLQRLENLKQLLLLLNGNLKVSRDRIA